MGHGGDWQPHGWVGMPRRVPGDWGSLWHPRSSVPALLRAPLCPEHAAGAEGIPGCAGCRSLAVLSGHRGCHPCPRSIPAGGPGGERTGKPATKSGQEPSALSPGYKRIYSISPRAGSALAPAPLGRRHAGNARARAFVAGFRSLSPNMVPGMESWSAAGPGAPGGRVWGGPGSVPR